MVRVVCVMTAMVLLFCGCASPQTQAVVSGFRCRADIVYGDSRYIGTFDRTSKTDATITLHEPDGMNGVEMRLQNGQVTVGYGGMQFAVSEDEMPIGSVIAVLCDTLDACADGVVQGSRVEGVCECGPFSLTLEEGTGMPLSLTVPSIGLEVTFSSWELPE